MTSINKVFNITTRYHGKINFSVYNSEGTSTTIGGAIEHHDTNWHHIVAIYDGANVYEYIDLVKEADVNPFSGNTINNPDRIGIGLNPGATGLYYYGLIDNVMIYDRALSEAEIQDIYNEQKPEVLGVKEEELDLYGIASMLNAIQETIEKLKQWF